MEVLNKGAANLLRSLQDFTETKASKFLESILVSIRSAMNRSLGLGICGCAAFGFLAIADRRTFSWK